jgi:hypothetical protein
MNPDVASAIAELEKRGILPKEKAAYLLRVARSELVSVHQELRGLLYLGVVLIVAGVGVLLGENLERIGPTAIALAIALAAAAAFFWVARTAPAFSWGEAPSAHLAFDYVLLLAVLLTAADLAYVEAQFTPLGENWPWHLLIVSVFMAAVALRFDSRVVFSLALSSFASWRGVSASLLVKWVFWSSGGDIVRANAVGCGAAFVILGAWLVHREKKPHFEPVSAHLGWLLILGALASGLLDSGARAVAFALGLLVSGGGLATYAFFRRQFSLFAMGKIGAYLGLSRLVLEGVEGWVAVLLWFLLSSLGALFALLRVHRAMREPV